MQKIKKPIKAAKSVKKAKVPQKKSVPAKAAKVVKLPPSRTGVTTMGVDRTIAESSKTALFPGESLKMFTEQALLQFIRYRKSYKEEARAAFDKQKKKKAS